MGKVLVIANRKGGCGKSMTAASLGVGLAMQVKPSLSQAVRLKKLNQSGTLTLETIDKILSEAKKPPKGEPTGNARYRRFFPTSYSPKQIDAVIVELLTDWKANVVI